MTKEKILVTAALPYVNNIPHIGNIVGSHLPADIFARFMRINGYYVKFIGGADEHGTPIEVAAIKKNLTPKELCDYYYEIHKKIYDWFNFSYDNFSRTSKEIHHKITQEFFIEIYKNGYIKEGKILLPYCENCNRVLPDRYVIGICPYCGYENARGDQCEKCGNILNPTDLKNMKCTICGSSPKIVEKEHLFFDIKKLKNELKEWIESKKGIMRQGVINESLAWIDTLKERCITRDLRWGVKVPLEKFKD
ncbi:MAG: class I tRNA ligase family protein, partial [Candidatus Altarchaeaceae archaeon]